MATGKMPPLPTLDPSIVGQTPEEQNIQRTVQGFYEGIHDPGFKDSYVAQQLGTNHQQRLATAQRHYQNALTFYQVLQSGKNPTSGAPLTDDEKTQYQTMLDGAWDDLAKVAGVDKDTKKELEQRKQMMDTALTHGHERVGQVASSLAGVGNMPPPPVETTEAPALMNAPGQAQPPGPGNMFNSPPGLVAPLLSQITQPAMLSRAGTQENVEAAGTAGIEPGTRDYQSAVLEGKLPALPSMTTGTYITKDGKPFNGRVERTTGQIVNTDTNEVVPGATKVTAGMQAAPVVVGGTGDTPPYGVKRMGETVTPGDPNFGPEDKKLLDTALDAYNKSQAAKDKRQKDYADAYARMRGQVYQYQVMELASGNPTYANANEINANPGKYAPLAGAQALVNRDKIFKEIDYSVGNLDKALDKLTDADDFTTKEKAELAFALRADDPRSATATLVAAGALGTMTEAKQDFVAALTSAQESALGLRSIAGMGQGSDMMRAAIINMLPSATTPTKRYATMQMKLLHGQIDSLHEAIPPAIKGVGAGNKPAANAGKTFSKKKWAAANPGKDVNAAEAQATAEGYKVVP